MPDPLTPDEREQVERDLAHLERQLAWGLAVPPMNRNGWVRWIQVTMCEIDRHERLLGITHVRAVA